MRCATCRGKQKHGESSLRGADIGWFDGTACGLGVCCFYRVWLVMLRRECHVYLVSLSWGYSIITAAFIAGHVFPIQCFCSFAYSTVQHNRRNLVGMQRQRLDHCTTMLFPNKTPPHLLKGFSARLVSSCSTIFRLQSHPCPPSKALPLISRRVPASPHVHPATTG